MERHARLWRSVVQTFHRGRFYGPQMESSRDAFGTLANAASLLYVCNESLQQRLVRVRDVSLKIVSQEANKSLHGFIPF